MGWTRVILGAVGVLIILMAISPAPAEARELIPFLTPPAGGGAYITAAGMVTVTNKYLSDVKLVHEATSSSMEIIRRMMQREAANKDAFGIFSCDEGWRAYKGEADFKGKPFTGLRAVVFNMATDLYFVVPGNSPIKSYADAKGKRIAMGGPGSGPANTAHFLLEQHGVQKKDFKPYYFTYKETVEGLQDGSLDGGFLAGGYPISSYSERALRKRRDDRKIARTAREPRHYPAATAKRRWMQYPAFGKFPGWRGSLLRVVTAQQLPASNAFAGQSGPNLQTRPNCRRGRASTAASADHLLPLGQSEGSTGRAGDVLRPLHQQLQCGVQFRFFQPAAPIGSADCARGVDRSWVG